MNKIYAVVPFNSVGREEGKNISKRILEFWNNGFILEFEDNFIPTSGFFAEIMYPLLEKYSIEEIKEKIEFKNMSRFTKGLLNDVTRSCIEMLKREKKDVKEQVIDLLEQQKKSENKM